MKQLVREQLRLGTVLPLGSDLRSGQEFINEPVQNSAFGGIPIFSIKTDEVVSINTFIPQPVGSIGVDLNPPALFTILKKAPQILLKIEPVQDIVRFIC